MLDLVYGTKGNVMRCEPGPELTDEIVAMLHECTEAAFESDTGFEVRRTIMFSVPEVKGFWRHDDEWQILPAPPNAPQPGFQLGEHPLILEYRVRRSTNDAIAIMRSRRHYWELCLLFIHALFPPSVLPTKSYARHLSPFLTCPCFTTS